MRTSRMPTPVNLLPRGLAIVLAVCAGLAAGTAYARAGNLSASELRDLFPGEFEAVWKDKIDLTLSAFADGRLEGQTWFVGDTGSWSVAGDILCITFGGWKKAKCGPVQKSGNWYLGLMRDDGTPRLKFRPR